MSYNKNLYDAVAKINQTYQELNEQLINETWSHEKTVEINKQIAQITEIVNQFKEYQKIINDYQESELLIKTESNQELVSWAQNELEIAKKAIPQIELTLQKLLLPQDPNEGKNVIMEMRPAAGGDESSIFVNDLFDCYKHYANQNQWKLQVLDASVTTIGTSFLSFSLSGKDVYSKMKFESGVHRVQRVPETEARGRVHTSTITVSVMVEQDEISVAINPTDLRVDVYRASGAGGQHVNKTESAVRITHLPTNIVVTCQEGKSQLANRDKAMKMLRAKLWQKAVDEQNQAIDQLVRAQVGRGDRAEKIRTYNYPQNRITDHRIGLSWNKLDTIMLGNLSQIHEALINDEQVKKIATFAYDK